MASPFNGTPDEGDHILRAYAVADGQIALKPESAIRGSGAFVDVPASLVRQGCWQFKSLVPASCAPEPGGDRTIVRVGSGAGRYHPLYYAAVGLPLRISPDWTGVLLSRLLSAGICAALLATALTNAMRWSRHRLMAVGVLAATTPMAVHMASAINPNGVEIAAGVLLFSAAIPLLYADGAERSRALLRHVLIAALVISLLRVLGPLWVTVAVSALLLPLRWARLRALWGWHAVRWSAAAVVVAMAASAAWTLVFKAGDMGDFTGGRRWSLFQALRFGAEMWATWADEMVGVTSWLDARMPSLAYMTWQFAVVALLVWGFVVAHRAGRWRMLALAAGAFGLPFAMQVARINATGWITQGRYLLPLAAGLPILAAFLINQFGLTRDKSRSLLRLFLVLLLPIHLVSLVYTMLRWQKGMLVAFQPLTGGHFGDGRSGLRGLNPFSGAWLPPLGPVVPIVAMTLGLAVVAYVVLSRRSLDEPTDPVSKEPAPGTVTTPAKPVPASEDVPVGA